MNTSDLLEQLLRAGQGSMAQQRGGGASAQGGLGDLGGLLGGLLGGGASNAGAGSMGGLGGLGGLLGGLLGAGSPMGGAPQSRSGGGTNYAALASLGMMAFQAYQAWQRSQAAQQQQAPQTAMRTVDMLAGAGSRGAQPCHPACIDSGSQGRWPDRRHREADDQHRNRPSHRRSAVAAVA